MSSGVPLLLNAELEPFADDTSALKPVNHTIHCGYVSMDFLRALKCV